MTEDRGVPGAYRQILLGAGILTVPDPKRLSAMNLPREPIAQKVEQELRLDFLPMGPEHLAEVLRIEQEAFSNPWRRADFEYAVGKQAGIARVGIEGGVLVGYAVGFLSREEFHLANLAVRRDLRGRGIGRSMLHRTVEAIRARGAKVVTLEVRVSNARAIGLYEVCGFRRMAFREGYYTHPPEDALVMVKTLQEDFWR